jgi:hypothetical protein
MEVRLSWGRFFKILWSPKTTVKSMLHAYGLLLVNFSVLNRDLVCRWCWSLQMIKIMQMEMFTVATLLPPGRPLVMMAVGVTILIGHLHYHACNA